MTKYLITVVGPTAVGKTALSIEIASHFKTEIISCDSRQFYKEMRIGTAVPTDDELNAISHHFIQDRSIFDAYNVGQFEKDALQKIEFLFKKYDVLILVGGSGLYLDAVLKGLDNFPKVDSIVRKKLKERLIKEGIAPLQEQLKMLDNETYQKMDIDNHQRLIRALEICIGTGKPYSTFLTATARKRNFKSIKIGLQADRKILYNRINTRVDLMLEKGLEREAQKLIKYKHLNSLQTVGYKELFNYFNKEYSFDFAVSEIKKNTRRFAKRQGTWFRKDTEIKWFDFNENPTTIIKHIEQIITIKK